MGKIYFRGIDVAVFDNGSTYTDREFNYVKKLFCLMVLNLASEDGVEEEWREKNTFSRTIYQSYSINR